MHDVADAPASRHRSLRAPLLALLVLAMVTACGNPPSPSPSPSASPTPSSPGTASPSSTGEAAACTSAELTATGGPWGAAAGSRGSDIVVENRGSSACLLPAGPTVALVDQAGSVLLANTPPAGGPGPSIEPGATRGFSVVIGNWCDQQVALPLHLSLALASGGVDIGSLTVTTFDELPPCNGPGQPPSLSTTEWRA